MVSLGWAGLDPALFWDENSSLGLSIPYITLGQTSAHPNEAMNSIKRMKLTGGAKRAWHVVFHNTSSPVFPPGK